VISTSRPDRFISEEKATGAYWVGGRVGPSGPQSRAGHRGEKYTLAPGGNLTPISQSFSLQRSFYTDRAIAGPKREEGGP
jgi:hypothetical protein